MSLSHGNSSQKGKADKFTLRLAFGPAVQAHQRLTLVPRKHDARTLVETFSVANDASPGGKPCFRRRAALSVMNEIIN